MDFGIALPTAADNWKVVRRAEELGFTHAWFYDTQMLSADCFVAMGAAAVNTRRIRLGTGVLVPSNRIAPVTANALASLNQLAPGRIDFGVGTGFTARRAMGFGAIKIKDMETYIHQVYGLLRRRNVALCIVDHEEGATPAVATADWGYFRLRAVDYSAEALARWAGTVRELFGAGGAFVYFKHEDGATGPPLARSLTTLLA